MSEGVLMALTLEKHTILWSLLTDAKENICVKSIYISHTTEHLNLFKQGKAHLEQQLQSESPPG